MRTVKLVFLDIDGVLNSETWWNRPEVRALPFYERSFDPTAVARLNRLTVESGAHIVLSSSWRTRRTKDAADLFKRVGIEGQAVGVTPWLLHSVWDHRHVDRGVEIQEYLARAGRWWIEAMCILDDGDDMGVLRDHLVQVDHRVGLQDRDVDLAESLLSRPNVEVAS